MKWFKEGLSANEVTAIDWKIDELLLNSARVKGFDLYPYFGCYNIDELPVGLDLGPIPRFKQNVLEETEKYVDVLAQTGAIMRRFKQAKYVWYNMPMFLSFPVKDRETWKEYKRRLNPYDPRRYPKDWEKSAYIKAFEDCQKGNTILYISGFYGFGAQLMGIPIFISMFYKDPGAH